jgi:cell filamentation protein
MAHTDGFLDPTSGVLRNKLNITDQDELNIVEGTKAGLRMIDLLAAETPHLDAAGLQAIHKYMFQDVYEWAGELRGWGNYQNLKDSSADSTALGQRTMNFGSYHTLPQHLDELGQQRTAETYLKGHSLPQFIDRAAYYFDQYNYAHGFREGNGRTLAVAFQLLGEAAGYTLDLTQPSNRQQYNLARDFAILRPSGDSRTDLQPLRSFFTHITQPIPGQPPAPLALVPVPAPTPFLQRVEAMREVQQTQEIIWRALLMRDKPLSLTIRQGVRELVLSDEQQPQRLAALKAGAQILLRPDAPAAEPRERQAATRLLRALPLATMLVLAAANLLSATAHPQQPIPPTFTLAEVPPAILERLGSSVQQVRASGQLEKLLQGQQTDPISGFKFPSAPGTPPAETFAVQLQLKRDEAGVAKLFFQLPEKQAAQIKATLTKAVQKLPKSEKLVSEVQEESPNLKRRGPRL